MSSSHLFLDHFLFYFLVPKVAGCDNAQVIDRMPRLPLGVQARSWLGCALGCVVNCER